MVSFAPMYSESVNEYQPLIEYPATDEKRMSLMVDFFLHAQPFRKYHVGEITQNWASMTKPQIKHVIHLLKDSKLFVVFPKLWNTEFMLKDDVREAIITEGSFHNYQLKSDKASGTI